MATKNHGFFDLQADLRRQGAFELSRIVTARRRDLTDIATGGKIGADRKKGVPAVKTETTAAISTRNYGVDTLRMLSMLMIVVAHIFTQGGVLANVEQGSAGWFAAWALRIFVIVDVNCFALITGYVSADSRFRASKVIALWLQLFAYSVGIAALFRILGIGAFQPMSSFFPVLSGRWWYMTAYFGIVLFLPFMGILLRNLSRRQASLLVLALICVFSLLPSVYYKDTFRLQGGYDMAWLAILALIGGYIKRFEPFEKIRRGWLIIYVVCMVCICAWKFFAKTAPDRFVNFTSIFALIGSAALVLFFSRISMAPAVRKLTKFLAPMTLGVYLIHVHPAVWNFVLPDLFAPLAQLSAPVMILCVIGSALVVFVFCAAVDWLRGLLFRLLRINKLADIVGDKLTALAEKVFK